MQKVLENCRVLDLSRLLPGPYCSMILADHGARVISIEDRRFESDALPELEHINRGKEHMTLNLKSIRGKQIFYALAESADVLLEGFRPGVTRRLGIDYEALRRRNPQIVYCSLTGYGQSGPLMQMAGHDINFLGTSGVLSLIGPENGGPTIPGIQVGDLAGGLYAAIGILMALLAREKTGNGQYIDIAMTDALMTMMPIAAGHYWLSGTPPRRGNWKLAHRYACYNIYETADSRYLTVGALEPRFWKGICDFFDVPEYIDLQYDEDRREELIHFFRKAFSTKTRSEWLAIFGGMDVCIDGVLDLDEALPGEYARARDMADADSPGIGTPIRLSETPGETGTRPPGFGEHTRSILAELGYGSADIQQMFDEGVI